MHHPVAMANRQEPNGRSAHEVALPDENRQSWRPQDDGYPGRRRPSSEEDDRFEEGRFAQYRDRFDRDRFARDRFERERDERERDHFGHWEDRVAREHSYPSYPGSFEDRYEREHATMSEERAAVRGISDRDRDRLRGPRGYGVEDGGPNPGTGGGGLRNRQRERHGAAGGQPARTGFRGKGPANFMRSDERIRELVCEALTEDDRVDATHVEVRVMAGEVTLMGTLDDRQQKRAAEECVETVAGVRDVQNQIRVVARPDDGKASR